MKIDNFFKGFFKEEPIQKEFKLSHLLTDSLSSQFLTSSLTIYQARFMAQEQTLIKHVLKALEEKTTVSRKIKCLMFWIEFSKITKYDLADILMNKKIKAFTQPAWINQKQLSKANLEGFLNSEVLIPLYNYFLKLSVNQQLYKTCLIGIIPEDQIFRRGSKIRFIWIFKIYNLVNLLIPIILAMIKIVQKFRQLSALTQIITYLYKDLIIMNDFIVKAIEEGSDDNFLLMPYFDMLQFSQSVTQQISTEIEISKIYKQLKDIIDAIQQPARINIDPQTLQQISTQALRIKLISQSLKNPKKDFTRLETEYIDRINGNTEKQMKTEIHQRKNLVEQFGQKYQHLD